MVSPSVRQQRAFSLVEVVIALGIISFCLVAVMGALPAGLKSMRSASDQTIQSQICTQLNARVAFTGFSRTQAQFDGKQFFFDDQGLEQSAANVDTRFSVRTSVATPAYPGSANAPASGNAALAKQYLTVRLELVTAASATAVSRQTNVTIIPVPNLGN